MEEPRKTEIDIWKSVKRAVPPLLTIIASISILSGAVWLHNLEGRNGPSNSTAVLGANGRANQFGSHAQNPSDPGPAHESTDTSNPAQSQTDPDNSKQSNSTTPPVPAPPSTPTSVDIGFAPVSGGTIRSLSNSPMSGGSQPSCIVTQYGQSPISSYSGSPIMTPSGTTVTLPKDMSARSLVVLPLQNGILWATVPAASLDASGRPDTSTAPTPMCYTPYKDITGANSSLTNGAISLGEIPVSVADASAAGSPTWYHPQQARTISATTHTTEQSSTTPSLSNQNTNTTNSSSPDNQPSNSSSSNTTDAPTANTLSPNTVSPTSSQDAAGACDLFLEGLYQTSNGAVIALSVNNTSSGTADTWLYLWNEQTQALKPITQLQNGHNSFSWFAVGRDVVYWETRQTVPPRFANFKGQQSVMNVLTFKVTQIHLGTWSSEGVAFGNALDFQVGNSVQWQEFNPSTSIAPMVNSAD